jgi:hypothetical protein
MLGVDERVESRIVRLGRLGFVDAILRCRNPFRDGSMCRCASLHTFESDCLEFCQTLRRCISFLHDSTRQVSSTAIWSFEYRCKVMKATVCMCRRPHYHRLLCLLYDAHFYSRLVIGVVLVAVDSADSKSFCGLRSVSRDVDLHDAHISRVKPRKISRDETGPMHRQYAQYEITTSHASSHVHLLLILERHTVHIVCSQHARLVDDRQHSSFRQYS